MSARIIVTGGRKYADAARLCSVLDLVLAKHGAITIVHGNASGADQLAHEWAKRRGAKVEPHPALWEIHGKAAGPRRNAEMAALGAVLCVAFPGGDGTADCVKRCEARGIPVLRVEGP